MTSSSARTRRLIESLQTGEGPLGLQPEEESRAPHRRIPGGARVDAKAIDRRWNVMKQAGIDVDAIRPELPLGDPEVYARNIENLVGTVAVPVAVAGPLRVRGLCASGDYYIPLATTEAALVASYNRGCLLISEAGGCHAILIAEGVSRAPGFAFTDAPTAAKFALWASGQLEAFRAAASETTSHGHLEDITLTIEGNHVYLQLEFTTGDAAGQNMVTIASQRVVNEILEQSPIKPEYHFLEANLSGDKKSSFQSFQTVRGRKVTAEIELSAELVEKRLHTTARAMENYWRMSALGGVMSGTIGVQGHYANGLAALFLATGQDVACVSEAAVGVTRLEETPKGSLYAAVTLPNLIIGTVGGGTGLPSQAACLKLMGLQGTGKARVYAEVCAALVLAGELSIIGALAAGEFATAHERLARTPRQRSSPSSV